MGQPHGDQLGGLVGSSGSSVASGRKIDDQLIESVHLGGGSDFKSSNASKSGKSFASAIVSGCYNRQSASGGAGEEGSRKNKKDRKKTASSAEPEVTRTTSSASSTSFLAGTVAATDQVLLKLVQRLASLRSNNNNNNNNNSSSNNNNISSANPNKTKKCKFSKLRKKKSPSEVLQPVQSKKPRCEEEKTQKEESVGQFRVQEEPNSVGADASLYGSGNGGPAEVIESDVTVVDAGERIDCISFSELIVEHQLPTFGGGGCNLVFCEIENPDGAEIPVGCDEILLVQQSDHDAGLSLVRELSEAIIEESEQDEFVQEEAVKMGANVSRHHEKGLTGRRAQSTDNLKSDQTQPYQYYYNGKGGNGGSNNNYQSSNNNNNNNHINNTGETTVGVVMKSVPPDLAPGGEFLETGAGQLDTDRLASASNGGINHHDRNKFCGSLPNHLDADDACEAIFKQNEFLQAHLKNVLASHQQQLPEYVTVTSSGGGVGGGAAAGGSANMTTSSTSQQQQQLPPCYQQNSPFYSSSSGKGSTISSTALGSSTFRSGSSNGGGAGGDRPDIQLKLPLHRTCPVDTGYDQGYGSERSPEDELPPPLLLMHEAQYNEILATSQLTQQPPASVIEPDDLQRFWNYERAAASLISSGEYSFITKDSVFLVQVPKGTRGLGLSVSGGSDSNAPFPGLIRIKRLFPHQAAWATGMLQPGDILLEANGIPLTGLTNYEALEVLRTAPNYVTLTVCRPQDEQYRKLSPPSAEPPKPPLRHALSNEPQSQMHSPQLSTCSSSSTSTSASGGGQQIHQQQQLQQQQLLHFQQLHQQQQQLSQFSQQQMMPYYYPQQQQQQQYMYPPQTLAFVPLDPSQSSFSGEFEIILTKQQGSLGFTLRKEDESVLGHYVRALVRDPALNDGRIKPGDKIVAVNDVPISQMTHEEAVIFLRQSAEVVKLRLYRDQAQTPISSHSPTLGGRRGTLGECGEEHGLCLSASTSTVGHGSKPKPNLRPEALNLLTDIAYRKQSANTSSSGGGGDSGSTSSSVKSSNASPRRLRRGLQGQQHPSKRSYDNHGFQHSGDTSNYSDSETSTIVSQGGPYHPHPAALQTVPAGVFHSASCRSCGGATSSAMAPIRQEDELYYCDDEIELESLYEDGDGDGGQQKRPTFLDLAGESGSTPMSSRKPRFQFSVATTNAYELNNLDNEALDAPTMYALTGAGESGAGPSGDQFMSLPCETFLVACKTEQDLNADSTDAIYVKHFAHKSPLYSSVNVPLKENVSEVVDAVEKGGKKSLMKWKGATLASDEDDTPSHQQQPSDDFSGSPSLTGSSFPTSSTPDAESSLAATLGTTTGSTTTPTTERDLLEHMKIGGLDGDGNKIFTVELNKGWNSRLGFSLKQDADSKRTVVSAIYSESVAAKDGRLRVGDQLLAVNDEPVDSFTTNQVIDLLRIIRGPICLRLVRPTGLPVVPCSIATPEDPSLQHQTEPSASDTKDPPNSPAKSTDRQDGEQSNSAEIGEE